MAGVADIGRMVATLGLNTSPFMASANGAMNSMRAMQVQMMMVGRTMTRFVTLPMALAGGGAIKMQKDFESSMTKVVSLVGIAREQVNEWKEDIFDIARETGRGPNELAEALYFVTSAGYRGAEAIDILRKSAMAAAGGLGQTKDVADLVTSAMYAYRKSNLSATEAMDAVIAAVREGKVEVTDLINSMGKVFPIASQFGVSIQEVGAAFASMTRSGTKADKASTQLRAILNQMMSPSRQVRNMMAGLAMTADDFQKILMEEGLIVALQKLHTAIKGDPGSYAKIFENIRALTGVLDIMGDNVEENIRIFERMKNSSGELRKVFEEVQATTQFKLDRSLARLGISAIKLGELLKDPLIRLLEGVSNALDRVSEWLDNMSEAQKRATLSLGLFIAGAGPALVIISRLSMMFAALGSSIGGIAILIGTITAAFVTYRKVLNSATRGEEIAGDIKKRTNRILEEETSKMKTLYMVARNEVTSKEARIAAIKEMQQIAPIYFGQLDAEKTKITDLTTAYDDYAKSKLMESRMAAITEAMQKERQAIMALESAPRESIKAWDKIVIGAKLFRQNFNNAVGAALGNNEKQWIDWQEAVTNVAQNRLSAHEVYLERLRAMFAEEFKAFQEYQALMKAAAGQTGTETESPELVGPSAGPGYMQIYTEALQKAQERLMGASEERIPALMDEIRGYDRILRLIELMGDEFGHIAKIQNDIAKLQIQQETATKDNWLALQSQVEAKQRELDYQYLLVDGLGAAEKLTWQIAEAERKLQNAAEGERDAIEEQIRLLRVKQDVMNEIRDPYREQILLAEEGTQAWREHYENRLRDLNKWMQTEEVTNDTYRGWQQERYDIEKMFQDYRRQQASNYLQLMSNVIGNIQSMIASQMSAEIARAKDNVNMRERIERDYQEKQKRWAMIQGAIQTALAVIKALPNVALAVATGIAGAAQIGFMASKSFAKGALVYGTTVATVGDYPSASSNPEVIAPLRDLQKYFPQGRRGSEIPKVIKLKLEGKDAVALIDTNLLLANTY